VIARAPSAVGHPDRGNCDLPEAHPFLAEFGELRETHRLYTEMGATGHAERVARELEALRANPD
jgi:hypothetical protein